MNSISFIWLIVFAIAALCFFGTAAVITVIGMRDLRDLLRKSESKDQLPG